MMNRHIPYRCPACLGELQQKEKSLFCAPCGSDFPVEGHAAIFFSTPPGADPLAALSAEVSAIGWAKTVEAHAGESWAQPGRNCADWRFFIPFGREAAVLEYGAGRGDVSLVLARNIAELHALSFSPSAARIIARRAVESGARNVFGAAVGVGERLPFPENAFDAFAADRILNFPALYAAADPVQRAAARLVREAHRVLKKGGMLFIGVGNPLFRLALLRNALDRLRKSEVEEDMNFRFNGRAAGLDEPGSGALSHSGYRRVLESAGFHAIRSFAPLPDPVRTKVTIPLESKAVQKYFFRNLIRQNTRTMRLASRLGVLAAGTGLFPHFVPYYYFLAEK
jgi:SAM-dependent methyltransferase